MPPTLASRVLQTLSRRPWAAQAPLDRHAAGGHDRISKLPQYGPQLLGALRAQRLERRRRKSIRGCLIGIADLGARRGQPSVAGEPAADAQLVRRVRPLLLRPAPTGTQEFRLSGTGPRAQQ